MASHLLATGIRGLEFARRATLGFVEDVPDDQWCHQPGRGANHACWIIGHLATTDNYFLTNLTGQDSKVPESWEKLFGMGSQPSPNRADYPAAAELKDRLRSRREDLLAWFRTLSPEKLLEPLPKDWQNFAPDHIGLAVSIAWHEGMHAGQLTVVRKSLGLAPKFG